MALVTTPGDEDADSYAAVAKADAYFLARGVATWTGTTTAKENALRVGTAYLDNQYRGEWPGVRTDQDQALAWPRTGVYDTDGYLLASDEIPVQIVNATCEAALLALTGVSLEPVLTRGNAIKRTVDKVGPLSQEIEYADGASGLDRFTAIEGLLRDLVNSFPGASAGTVRLVRG